MFMRRLRPIDYTVIIDSCTVHLSCDGDEAVICTHNPLERKDLNWYARSSARRLCEKGVR